METYAQAWRAQDKEDPPTADGINVAELNERINEISDLAETYRWASRDALSGNGERLEAGRRANAAAVTSRALSSLQYTGIAYYDTGEETITLTNQPGQNESSYWMTDDDDHGTISFGTNMDRAIDDFYQRIYDHLDYAPEKVNDLMHAQDKNAAPTTRGIDQTELDERIEGFRNAARNTDFISGDKLSDRNARKDAGLRGTAYQITANALEDLKTTGVAYYDFGDETVSLTNQPFDKEASSWLTDDDKTGVQTFSTDMDHAIDDFYNRIYDHIKEEEPTRVQDMEAAPTPAGIDRGQLDKRIDGFKAMGNTAEFISQDEKSSPKAREQAAVRAQASSITENALTQMRETGIAYYDLGDKTITLTNQPKDGEKSAYFTDDDHMGTRQFSDDLDGAIDDFYNRIYDGLHGETLSVQDQKETVKTKDRIRTEKAVEAGTEGKIEKAPEKSAAVSKTIDVKDIEKTDTKQNDIEKE